MGQQYRRKEQMIKQLRLWWRLRRLIWLWTNIRRLF